MYAVIETGGKQFKVAEGDILRVEKLDGDKGSSVEFDKILLLEQDGQVRIGRPYVEGVKVTAKVLVQDKARKIIVFKYMPKKHYKKKSGHRQPFTEIKIESIIA
ncbi:MAG: 50S ribosomal protein L21 [bacterium]|jgi:large subunit ribosomal protein L21|nr:50S ribosomal protein L21 [bacterium]MDD3805001.1 50S ribosomal protein L21 [bacterium]MDD4153445.1 50S ribosomal protein L21 [bacterium]MDD4558205.1 50S ribosomal protein L21 [bacterium]